MNSAKFDKTSRLQRLGQPLKMLHINRIKKYAEPNIQANGHNILWWNGRKGIRHSLRYQMTIDLKMQ